MVSWNRYTSDGAKISWLVLITHPTSRFPNMANTEMTVKMTHRITTAVGSKDSYPHSKVSGSGENDSLDLL